MQDLKQKFAEIGLKIKIAASDAANISNTDIFQLSINNEGQANNYKEYYTLSPGKDNYIEVTSIDKTKHQLVMHVQEPKRVFYENTYDPIKKVYFKEKHTTPENLRKYLLGKDERHLFITEYNGISNVKNAHENLKPAIVQAAEIHKLKIVRQGEWFFVEPTLKQKETIEKELKSPLVLLFKKIPVNYLRPKGNPHIADELLRIKSKDEFFTYVRGHIRHIQHKTITLPGWMSVYKNTEIGSANWVD